MKEAYLQEIKKILKEKYEINSEEVKEIIEDYKQMYEEGLSQGLTDSDIINKLGYPEDICDGLKDNYKEKQPKKKGGKIVALTPFVAIIIFFLLGYFFDAWKTAWMIFFIIPVTAIIVSSINTPSDQAFTSISPFLAVITYLVFGIQYGIWHPTWLVFLIVPISGILSNRKNLEPMVLFIALCPFIALTAFFTMGYFNLWHVAWLVFLLIPMAAITKLENKGKMIILELAFMVAIAFYLVLGFGVNEWAHGLLGFLLPSILVISLGDFTAEVDGVKTKHYDIRILAILLISIYFSMGVLLDDYVDGYRVWAYLWLIFLLIPIYGILRYASKRAKLIGITPFVSLIIFFTLGFFANLWTISWMAFLLIPIIAVLTKNNHDDED